MKMLVYCAMNLVARGWAVILSQVVNPAVFLGSSAVLQNRLGISCGILCRVICCRAQRKNCHGGKVSRREILRLWLVNDTLALVGLFAGHHSWSIKMEDDQ
jgi:hypothetical protein